MEDNLQQDKDELKRRLKAHAFLDYRAKRPLAKDLATAKREAEVRKYRSVVRRTAADWGGGDGRGDWR